jgi:hypothetical protein
MAEPSFGPDGLVCTECGSRQPDAFTTRHSPDCSMVGRYFMEHLLLCTSALGWRYVGAREVGQWKGSAE